MTRTIFIFLVLIPFVIKAQYRYEYIAENERITLNGGLNASFGGRSRTILPIELKKGCVGLVYSYTAFNNSTPVQSSFPLVAGIAASLTGQVALGEAISKIDIPVGNQCADAYLLPTRDDAQMFELKRDGSWNCLRDYSRQNRTECKVSILTDGGLSADTKVFLGFKNPSTLNAVNINVNVVAVYPE